MKWMHTKHKWLNLALVTVFFAEQAYAADAAMLQQAFAPAFYNQDLAVSDAELNAFYLEIASLKDSAAIATAILESEPSDRKAINTYFQSCGACLIQQAKQTMRQSVSQVMAKTVQSLLKPRFVGYGVQVWQPNYQMKLFAKEALRYQLTRVIQAHLKNDGSLSDQTTWKVAQVLARGILETQSVPDRWVAYAHPSTNDNATTTVLTRTPSTSGQRVTHKRSTSRISWNAAHFEDMNPLHQFLAERPKTGPPAANISLSTPIQAQPLDYSKFEIRNSNSKSQIANSKSLISNRKFRIALLGGSHAY